MNAYETLAPFYDALTRDVNYTELADFYESVFRRYNVKPGTILDLACGTGTLCCELAARGYEVIGVDSSDEMLAEAMEKVCGGGYNIRPMLLCQDMTELDLYGTVAAAICSLDGFNYLNDEELALTFRRLRLFIEPGGMLIFDVNTPEKLKNLSGQTFIDETENVFCVWRPEYDDNLDACVYGMDIFTRTDGGSWRRSWEEHIEYAHSRERLAELLTDSGFGSISVYDGSDGMDPALSAERVFFAAVREP